jgi:hypothetical protein
MRRPLKLAAFTGQLPVSWLEKSFYIQFRFFAKGRANRKTGSRCLLVMELHGGDDPPGDGF